MKIAVAGKGGVGKTTLTAWLGYYLSRQGKDVWVIDGDTNMSLGLALGLKHNEIPDSLVENKELVNERVGVGFINLNPKVADLPERLSVETAGGKLLVMGTVTGAGKGCACSANSLLKALLHHLIIGSDQWVIVDLEAGVEHLGRGTIQGVDALIIVSESKMISLRTAARISSLARDLGLENQILVLNREALIPELESIPGLPPLATTIPRLQSLDTQQIETGSVLDLAEQEKVDGFCSRILTSITKTKQ